MRRHLVERRIFRTRDGIFIVRILYDYINIYKLAWMRGGDKEFRRSPLKTQKKIVIAIRNVESYSSIANYNIICNNRE